ncbi:unnamed protein product [Schistosoma turkestanicum]|nr:unnamed protein product [Schistosoma turkestanicum]
MATLPSCMYWTFTNSGLLIQDWLLKPVRPINLNEAINQLYFTSVIHSKDYQLTNSMEGGFNEHNTTDYHNNHNHNNNNRTQQILQIIFYFSLPLLPAATILFAIVNIFIESKHYTCPKYRLFPRPYIQRLSQYLIVFYVLTGINASLIWLVTLPRYIPMSTGHYTTTLLNEINMNATLSTHMDISSQYYNHTPKFITQLPAMLTMQIVLRLTLCWLTIGLMIDRIHILSELHVNPFKKSFGYYINYLFTIVKENFNENHCLNTLDNTSNNKLLNSDNNTQPNSMFQCLLKFGAKLCSIQQKCSICKQINYNWTEEYACFMCAPNYLYPKNLCTTTTTTTNPLKNAKQQQSDENFYLMMQHEKVKRKTKNKFTNYTSIGRLILMTSALITCSLAICLPQVWSYQLIGINLKIKLFNNNIHTTTTSSSSTSTSTQQMTHEKLYPAWRLLNKTGQTLYEYCFAAISFVIPCCTMIVCLLLLVIRLLKMKCELKHIIIWHHLRWNKSDMKYFKLYVNIVKYCLMYLLQDCVLILILGTIQLCCSIPHLMTNSINRLECLLINNYSGKTPVATSSTSSSTSSASSLTSSAELFWPTRQNWLLIELNYLFGDFLTQLIILSVRLCETNHLLTRNESFETGEHHWLKLISMNKQNYHIVKCQHMHNVNESQINEHLIHCERSNQPGHNDEDGDSDAHDADVDGVDVDGVDDNSNHDPNNMDVDNGDRKKLYAYPIKTPTDSGQTSKNISPLPISHTISDVLLSPKFRLKQTSYRLNQQHKTHRSTPSALPSPLLQRIPEMINYDPLNSHQQHPQPHQQCNSNLMKYSINSYVEPKTSMASLTYSPRSRHPCRLQHKKLPVTGNNTSLHLSNLPISIQSTSKLMTTPTMQSIRTERNSQLRNNNSPPPLPPPPKHLVYMLGGDSSIYSTPHGSPQQEHTRQLMIFNNSNNNTTVNNISNISVDYYSPDLLHISNNMSKHGSPTNGSFRQTDSGVTNMGGSLIDSEHYEPNTMIM